LLIFFVVLTAAALVFFLQLHGRRWTFQNNDSIRDFWVSFGFEFFLFVWVFFFGASLASFLNVVAYRLPRKLSLLGSSFCPHCRVPISASDNLPVIGWWLLRGRCRACRLPIAVRYPINEAIGGAIVLACYVATVMGHGWNLPGRFEADEPFGVTLNFARLDLDFVWLAAIQATVLLVLFTVSLVEANGKNSATSHEITSDEKPHLPIFFWLILFALFIGLFLLQPLLYIQPTSLFQTPLPSPILMGEGSGGRADESDTSKLKITPGVALPTGSQSIKSVGLTSLSEDIPTAANSMLLGFLAAMLCGWIVCRQTSDVFYSWLLLGLVFGWQFVAMTAFTAAVYSSVVRWVTSPPRLWLIALLLLLFWRNIDWMAGDRLPIYRNGVYGLMLLVSVLTLVAFRKSRKEQRLVHG
jgi:prepilin signal peptidase PulO-like enzyme (type II secretory pathway)